MIFFIFFLSIFFSFSVNLHSKTLTDNDLKAIEILKKEAEKEKNNIDLIILNKTYAKIKPFGKFKLKKWKILPVENNIYKLFLEFKKKKGIFKIKKEAVLYFWYFDNQIFFLSSNGVIKFKFPEPAYKITKTKNGYILKEMINKKEYQVKITLPEKIKLYLWFKRK